MNTDCILATDLVPGMAFGPTSESLVLSVVRESNCINIMYLWKGIVKKTDLTITSHVYYKRESNV